MPNGYVISDSFLFSKRLRSTSFGAWTNPYVERGGVNLSPPEKRYVGIFEVYPGMAEQYSSYVPHCV